MVYSWGSRWRHLKFLRWYSCQPWRCLVLLRLLLLKRRELRSPQLASSKYADFKTSLHFDEYLEFWQVVWYFGYSNFVIEPYWVFEILLVQLCGYTEWFRSEVIWRCHLLSQRTVCSWRSVSSLSYCKWTISSCWKTDCLQTSWYIWTSLGIGFCHKANFGQLTFFHCCHHFIKRICFCQDSQMI